MKTYMTAEIGDKIFRENKMVNNEIKFNRGVVIDITDSFIICEFMVDTRRTMMFNRDDGVHEYGSEYGWLM